ncbi:MAG: glucose-6-phosphate isomerase [Aquificae bacterium]|nr:glucose-6-phosphate isomerase [Aquificota bacterium]
MIKIDYTNVMADMIGEINGILKEEILFFKDFVKEIQEEIKNERNKSFFFTQLPYQDTSLIKEVANKIREKFDFFVLIGIGGSSLGAEMLIQSLKGLDFNLNKKPKFFVMDNVDPEKFDTVLKQIEIEKTCFNVVSKSGSTVETIANFSIVLKLLKDKLGENWKNHFIFTTDPQKGFLRKFGKENNIQLLDIPSYVGGRFSVLTPVGLLPAAVLGIDIDDLLAGARKMDFLSSEEEKIKENPAILLSLIHYISNVRKRKTISVMMPYSERLSLFVDWYRQLWAESLGKEGFGQTPVKAIGTIDQHSQIQLYRDGIKDKIITFIQVEKSDIDYKIPEDLPEEINYLSGHSLHEILNKELLGTKTALVKSKVPNLTITLDKITSYNIGMLLYLYEYATGFSGYLYRINPFDQPAVEEGKNFTYALMGRKGYENKLKEFKKLYKEKYLLKIV